MSRNHALSAAVLALVFGTAAAATACTGRVAAAAAGDVAPEVQPRDVVTSEVLADAGDTPIEKVLADRIPGVRLDRATDGHLILRIRGTSSWSSASEPLFVVDGTPLTSSIGGALVGINKYDIDRIRVLKDAASTAMYGVRGASGVVLIETKKP